MSVPLLNPRTIYVPTRQEQDPTTVGLGRWLASLPRDLFRACVAFYRDRVAWLALLVTSVMLCYVGGAAMFWFHAEHLGEGGPVIPWYVHWMLDSTFGFLVLTPVLLVILPLAAWTAQTIAGRVAPKAVTLFYVLLAGVAFAIVTTPGPVAHDLVVGRGTWIAGEATKLFGDTSAPLLPIHQYSLLAKLTQQLGFGLPLYLVLMGLAVLVVRSLTAPRRAAEQRG